MRTKSIKKWLITKDYSQAMIARELGLHRQYVNDTIRGLKASPKIIRWLLEHGCPKIYLDEPRYPGRPKMKAA